MNLKAKLRESLINHNKLSVVCNTMSVDTYEEGIALIIKAIGPPDQNPKIWNQIAKPLKNWKNEEILINNEVKQKHMSGDSMVDESNTYWSMIQSTICQNT